MSKKTDHKIKMRMWSESEVREMLRGIKNNMSPAARAEMNKAIFKFKQKVMDDFETILKKGDA